MTGLLGPAEIRELANRLGVRPTKQLGQNFVHDANTVRRIVALADLAPEDIVVEVGPGLGSLTVGLVQAAAGVYAVEIDPVLAGALPSTVAKHAVATDLPVTAKPTGAADLPATTGREHGSAATKLTVLPRDAMKVRADEFVHGMPTALVANLPYNVAVPVVLHLLAELPSLRHGLVMVQQEVADRLTAGPGSRVYGVPSVKLAWYASSRSAGKVPPSVFWPVPRVDSGLVAFTRREPPAADRAATFGVIDAAFAQRRKTLRAALAGWAGGPDAAEAILRRAGVAPGARGESLDVEDFARIARTAGTGGRDD